MSRFPLLMGVRLRATKVNSCGLPVEGPGNYAVTDGFVKFSMEPNMKDANDLEQENAQGQVCVAERTPPQRKWHDLELELCDVNTCLVSMFSGYEQEVDVNGDPVGFRDREKIDEDYGVAIEIWSGGRADDDCPVPDSDDIFASSTSGKRYGYLLTWGREWQVSGLSIGAEVSTFTLKGISFAGTQWGKGPWNVVDVDGDGTAGRLLVPANDDQHYILQRTPIAPPEDTGSNCCELDIQNTFDGDYFGDDAAEVAPDQPDCGDGSVSDGDDGDDSDGDENP